MMPLGGLKPHETRHQLENKATPIGANDMFTAATVLAHNGGLGTANEDEFSLVKDPELDT
jgi:predicted nucleic acid-binding protein